MVAFSARLNTLANRIWQLAPGARISLEGRELRLVAHRGAHGHGEAVENTMPAFERCLQSGVWGIELDIRMTRDGEPVVSHDPDCGRLFGRPDLEIAQTDFARLRAAVPDIPQLDEVIARFGGRMHLMLEVKESPTLRPGYAERVNRALEALVPMRDYHLLSLIPRDLEAFRDTPRSAFIDVAWMNTGRIIRENRELGHGGVAGSFALLGKRRLRRLHEQGRQVGTGFVETPGALRREVYRDVDWIFTNEILRLLPDPRSAS